MANAPTSAKDLFVLGRIALRPTYGHEIMRTLAASRSDLWAEMSEKHVYYVLRKLERDGLIEVTSARDGGRPARHVYSITPSGAAEFERLMRSERLTTSTPYSDFDVLFGMLVYTDRLSPAEKDDILAARVAHLRSVVADAEDAASSATGHDALQRTHVLSSRVFSKVGAVATAELEWLTDIQAELAEHGWPSAQTPNNSSHEETNRSDS